MGFAPDSPSSGQDGGFFANIGSLGDYEKLCFLQLMLVLLVFSRACLPPCRSTIACAGSEIHHVPTPLPGRGNARPNNSGGWRNPLFAVAKMNLRALWVVVSSPCGKT